MSLEIEEVGSIEFNTEMTKVINSDWTKALILETDSVLNFNKQISINELLWQQLNANHSEEAIKRFISRTITDHNIPMPLPSYQEYDALKSFRELRAVKVRSNLMGGKIYSRMEYNFALSDYYIGVGPGLNSCSNFFHQNNRWAAGGNKYPSPADLWNMKRHHNTFLNAFWSMGGKKVTTSTLYSSVSIRSYIAAQFKPEAAKTFYEMFNAKHVLDLSSGWGDRLAGFCASSAKSYVGLDPNENLIEGYAKQKALYGKGKDITMVCTGSEDYKPKRKFDTIFTSPPYFNIERYSQCENDSFIKNPTFDKWRDNFLLPTMDMAWKALDYSHKERGGIICINISDTLDNNERVEICEALCRHLEKKKGARYIGSIGLRLVLRPNTTNGDEVSERKETGTFTEPMWIFARGGTWDLEDYIEHGFASEKVSNGLFD